MNVVMGPEAGVSAARLAAFAAPYQGAATGHIAYLGETADVMVAEIQAVPAWRARSAVVIEDGALVGWLLAECDLEIGRVWWWGPFAAQNWDAVADALYAEARAALPDAIHQEECAGSDANRHLAGFCLRHGFEAGPASVVLTATADVAAESGRVRAPSRSDAARVAALHDALFPTAHRLGGQLVAEDNDTDLVAIAVQGDEILGYAVAQVQPDATGYVDFVGVAPAHRRRGVGKELVEAVAHRLVEAGATSLALSVRASNRAARALYRSLGFREEQVLCPYRKGFAI